MPVSEVDQLRVERQIRLAVALPRCDGFGMRREKSLYDRRRFRADLDGLVDARRAEWIQRVGDFLASATC